MYNFIRHVKITYAIIIQMVTGRINAHAYSKMAVALFAALLLGLAAPALAPYAHAQTTFGQDPEDTVLEEIGVDERLGAMVPLDTVLTGQDGRRVKLGDYFTGEPVVLSLNYYECPMLCPLTFRNLARTIDEMGGLKLGKDLRVVTVSFNPDERQDAAREKSTETYGMLKGVDNPGEVWPFLFGDGAQAVVDAVGFRYRKLGPGNFAHPSAFVILSPDGKITRYLYGMEVSPFDLRLALTEAADGKTGQSQALNRVLLFCFHYDPAGRKYSVAATRVMTAMGALVAVGMFVLLYSMWRREKKRGVPGTGDDGGKAGTGRNTT